MQLAYFLYWGHQWSLQICQYARHFLNCTLNTLDSRNDHNQHVVVAEISMVVCAFVCGWMSGWVDGCHQEHAKYMRVFKFPAFLEYTLHYSCRWVLAWRRNEMLTKCSVLKFHRRHNLPYLGMHALRYWKLGCGDE